MCFVAHVQMLPPIRVLENLWTAPMAVLWREGSQYATVQILTYSGMTTSPAQV